MAPASRIQTHTPVPTQWRPSDLEKTASTRWGVELARFPSAALAEGLRTTMLNLGWRPAQVVAMEGQFLVVVGNFRNPARAHYVAADIVAQSLATAKVTALPPTASGVPESVEIEGPLLVPFLPTPDATRKPFDWPRERFRLQGIAREMSERDRDLANSDLARLTSEATEAGVRATAAMAWAERLERTHQEPETALFLAGKVARNEWQGAPGERMRAGEIVADHLYATRRDWRGAWAATLALKALPGRTPAQRTHDEVRMAALEAELAAQGGTGAPTFRMVRGSLRRTWEAAPPEARDERAKAELIYLQTFAWEGDWDRVRPLAEEFQASHPGLVSESALAAVYWARSCERTADYDRGLQALDRVLSRDHEDLQGISVGGVTLDIVALARETRSRLVDLRAGASGATPPAKAPAATEETTAPPARTRNE